MFYALLLTTLLFLLQIPAGDTHDHQWDDLRLLPVRVLTLTKTEMTWKHTEPHQTRTGRWKLGAQVREEQQQATKEQPSRLRQGGAYYAIYCSECKTVVRLWDIGK